MDNETAIHRLLVACDEDERTLRHEASHVDPVRARVLVELADERKAFVQALRALPGLHFGATHQTARAFLRGVGSDVRATATGLNSSDAIAACRRSQARIEETYGEVMAQPWTPEVTALLTSQWQRVLSASERLLSVQF